MTKNAQRLSQLISTFGPGAMIDLPTRSVVVAGLEFWEMRNLFLDRSLLVQTMAGQRSSFFD